MDTYPNLYKETSLSYDETGEKTRLIGNDNVQKVTEVQPPSYYYQNLQPQLESGLPKVNYQKLEKIWYEEIFQCFHFLG